MRIGTPFGRFYNCEGKYYPSVTTVLSKMSDDDGLQQWRDRVGEEEANKITKQSTDRGTELHLMIEKYLQGEEYKPRYPFVKFMFPTIKPYLDRITDVKCQEYPLYSHKLKLAGTVDCVGSYEGLPSIIDFKNSNQNKTKEDIWNYFTQTTLYSVMFKERFGLTYPNLVVIMATEKMKGLVFVDHVSNYLDDALTLMKNFYKKYKNELSQDSILNRDREA